MDQTERSKPPRRSGLKEAAGKNITIRLPLDLYDKINSEWNKRGFKSKTDMIEHICKVYLASLPCPSCGALNPPNGVECAVCGEKLTPYYQAIEELNVVGNKVVKMITLVVSSLNALLDNIELMKKQRKQNSTDKYHIYGDILENINTMIDREKITIQLYLGLVPCFSPHDTLFDAEDYLKCCLEKMPHVKKGTQEMMSLMYSEKERLEMLVEAFGAMHKENTRFIVVTRCLTTLDEDLPTLLSELSEEYPAFIADTFYPELAQFGLVGVLTLVACVLWFCKRLKLVHRLYGTIPFVAGLLVLVSLGIDAVASTGPVNSIGENLFAVLGMILAKVKYIDNKRADEALKSPLADGLTVWRKVGLKIKRY